MRDPAATHSATFQKKDDIRSLKNGPPQLSTLGFTLYGPLSLKDRCACMISGGAALDADHQFEWLFRSMVVQLRMAATSPTNDGRAQVQCIERFLFCARASGPARRRRVVSRSPTLPKPGRTSPFGHPNSLLRSQAPLVACRLRFGHDTQRCNSARAIAAEFDMTRAGSAVVRRHALSTY